MFDYLRRTGSVPARTLVRQLRDQCSGEPVSHSDQRRGMFPLSDLGGLDGVVSFFERSPMPPIDTHLEWLRLRERFLLCIGIPRPRPGGSAPAARAIQA